MFFTECVRLVERHPGLAGAVQQIDAQLAEIRADGIIREADLASFLRIDPNQVNAVLGKLAQEGLLRTEEMVECVHCRMAVLRSEYQAQVEEEGEYRCTSCHRPLADTSIKTITVYRRGEKWKEVPPPPEDSSDKTSPVISALDDNGWYTYGHLADAFGVGKDALRKRLERYRESNLGGDWKEQANPQARETKYLFKLKAVRDILDELRASSKRPAK